MNKLGRDAIIKPSEYLIGRGGQVRETAPLAFAVSDPALLSRSAFAVDHGDYLNSIWYDGDLAAVRAIWSGAATAETAGCFVFLTYLTLPPLVSVRAPGGASRMANSVLDGQTERLFLQRLLGLACDRSWSGGIRNPKVHRMAAAISDLHVRFPGMRHEYLDLIASLLTLAPLRVHDHSGCQADSEIRGRYWRYMTAAMSLMRAHLAEEPHAGRLSSGFVAGHSGLTAEGEHMIRIFSQRHPAYTRMALPVLFPRSQSLVLPIIGDSDV